MSYTVSPWGSSAVPPNKAPVAAVADPPRNARSWPHQILLACLRPLSPRPLQRLMWAVPLLPMGSQMTVWHRLHLIRCRLPLLYPQLLIRLHLHLPVVHQIVNVALLLPKLLALHPATALPPPHRLLCCLPHDKTTKCLLSLGAPKVLILPRS